MAKAVPACADAASDDTFTCLRKATAKDIQDAQDKVGSIFPFFPVVDGTGGIVPDRASALIAKGGFTKLPFIAGTNLDEGLHLEGSRFETRNLSERSRYTFHTRHHQLHRIRSSFPRRTTRWTVERRLSPEQFDREAARGVL